MFFSPLKFFGFVNIIFLKLQLITFTTEPPEEGLTEGLVLKVQEVWEWILPED